MRNSAVLVFAAFGFTSFLALPAAGAEPEATSLLGCPLISPAPAAENPHAAAIAELEGRLQRDPQEAGATLWLGRRLGYLGQYRNAIETLTAGVRRYPQDARFLRHRGHRYLTTRQLDLALADFTRGLALVEGRPDEVEADGLPNVFNQPTGTLKTNLWYHLGLTYYLQGDFVRAGEAFHACLALSDNPDMAVASIYWRYLALRRQGRANEARTLLETPLLRAPLIENVDYQRLLQLFKGERKVEDLLGSGGADGVVSADVASATVAYGVAIYLQLEDQPEQARLRLKQTVAGKAWAAFGYLAAEAELARSSPKPPCP